MHVRYKKNVNLFNQGLTQRRLHIYVYAPQWFDDKALNDVTRICFYNWFMHNMVNWSTSTQRTSHVYFYRGIILLNQLQLGLIYSWFNSHRQLWYLAQHCTFRKDYLLIHSSGNVSWHRLIKIWAWINNYINVNQWDVTIHPIFQRRFNRTELKCMDE